jgi:hypothetical protein
VTRRLAVTPLAPQPPLQALLPVEIRVIGGPGLGNVGGLGRPGSSRAFGPDRLAIQFSYI